MKHLSYIALTLTLLPSIHMAAQQGNFVRTEVMLDADDSLAVVFPEDAGKEYVFPTLHYYAKDHLGNVRAVLSASGKVEQATHYYPFGAVIADISTGASLQKHKFSGKELDLMHGLNTYDFGARQYVPLLGV